MVMIDGQKVDKDHPAIQTFAAIVQKDTGHLTAKHLDELIKFLEYLDPNNEKYHTELAGELDSILRDAMLANEIVRERENREPNSVFKVKLTKQTDLLQRLTKVYREHVKRNESVRRDLGRVPNFWPERHLLSAINGMIEVRQKPNIEILADMIQRDTGHLTEDQIQNFIQFLDYLEPGNKKYNRELVENLDQLLQNVMRNREPKNGEPDPTFNLGLDTLVKLLDRLTEVSRAYREGNHSMDNSPYRHLLSALGGAIDVRKAMQQSEIVKSGKNNTADERTDGNETEGNKTADGRTEENETEGEKTEDNRREGTTEENRTEESEEDRTEESKSNRDPAKRNKAGNDQPNRSKTRGVGERIRRILGDRKGKEWKEKLSSAARRLGNRFLGNPFGRSDASRESDREMR